MKAKSVGQLLRKKKQTLSLAESCTGGAIASSITDIPGASDYFERGVVVYSNRSKQDLLGVQAATLKKCGAVSEETAREMAEGMRQKSKTTYSIAVTGVAGPVGGTKEKPVGTVYIAWATPTKTVVKHFCFPGTRAAFKKLVVTAALDGLKKLIL